MHPSAEKFKQAAKTLGLAIDIVEFEQTTRSADDAAAAIGCEVGQIVKSLVFLIEGQPVVILVSGANRLDVRKLAGFYGSSKKRVKRADADTVKSATGFSIGGVPPFGHSRQLPMYVDQDLTAYDLVWAAAGTPNAVFAIDPKELLSTGNGVVGDLKVDPS